MQTARTSGWGKGGVYQVCCAVLVHDVIPSHPTVMQGFVVSVVGITVYRGAFFGLYDTSQMYYSARLSTHHPIPPSCSARVSEQVCCWLCCDRVRRVHRVSVRHHPPPPHDDLRIRPAGSATAANPTAHTAQKYSGALQCFAQVVRAEGVPALFKGARIAATLAVTPRRHGVQHPPRTQRRHCPGGLRHPAALLRSVPRQVASGRCGRDGCDGSVLVRGRKTRKFALRGNCESPLPLRSAAARAGTAANLLAQHGGSGGGHRRDAHPCRRDRPCWCAAPLPPHTHSPGAGGDASSVVLPPTLLVAFKKALQRLPVSQLGRLHTLFTASADSGCSPALSVSAHECRSGAHADAPARPAAQLHCRLHLRIRGFRARNAPRPL